VDFGGWRKLGIAGNGAHIADANPPDREYLDNSDCEGELMETT
jgi:hypothetical protein